MKYVCFFVLVLITCLDAQIHKWEVFEISFVSADSLTNPFDIELNCIWKKPNGIDSIIVPCFYDGNGVGGQDGRVWKCRLHLDTIGVWTYYTTGSGDAGLDGYSGDTLVIESLSSEKGAIEVCPTHPYRMRYKENGEPAFLSAAFLDENWSWDGSYSGDPEFSNTMVYLSHEIGDTTRNEMIKANMYYKNKRMNIYLANSGDYPNMNTPDVLPWVGTYNNLDYTKFNLPRMHNWDEWIQTVIDSGLAVHFWFLADNSYQLRVPGNLSETNFKRLIRYAVARWGGYSRVLWCLTLEYEENNPDTSEWNKYGKYLREVDPYNHPRTIHQVAKSGFVFANQPWVDFMVLQMGFNKGHSTINSRVRLARGLAQKPVFAEEFARYNNNYRRAEREESWAAITAGAATLGTGNDLRNVNDFIDFIGDSYQRMSPHNELKVGGSNAYVLADPGKTYLVSMPDGGSVDLNLTADTFDVVWFNPESGIFSGDTVLVGNNPVAFTPPSNVTHDWVLSIQKSRLLLPVYTKVFLEGAYDVNGNKMTTNLKDSGFLPYSHPYSNPPWNQTPFTVSTIPDSVVDWVLVELRTDTTASSLVDTKVAFIEQNGNVVDTSGSVPVKFLLVSGDYYIVIHHRNHLSIMSATPHTIDNSGTLYDFTTSQSKAYGINSMKELENGVFGMYAGDADANGQVQNDDKNVDWKSQVGTAGYKTADFNLNGQVQNDDKNTFWRSNVGLGTRVP